MSRLMGRDESEKCPDKSTAVRVPLLEQVSLKLSVGANQPEAIRDLLALIANLFVRGNLIPDKLSVRSSPPT